MERTPLRTVDAIVTTASCASPGRIVPVIGDTERTAKPGSVVSLSVMLKRCSASFELTRKTLT